MSTSWPTAQRVFLEHLRAWHTGAPVIPVYLSAVDCLEAAHPGRSPEQLTRADLELVRDELLAGGHDAGEAVHAVVAWRTFFAALEAQGLLASNPARHVALPLPSGGRLSAGAQ